jgi:hypothetical protein
MHIAKAAATAPANTLKEAFRRIVMAIPQHTAKALEHE